MLNKKSLIFTFAVFGLIVLASSGVYAFADDFTLPTCSVDYLQGVYGQGNFYFSDSIYISETGTFEVYGSSNANDPLCQMDTVQYNRTSPNPYYVPSWKTASYQSPDWSLWKTDVNDAPFIDGWHEICCLPTSQECHGGGGGPCGDYIVGEDSCIDFCIDTQNPPQVTGVTHSNPSLCVPNYVNEEPAWAWDAVEDLGCAGINYYEVELYTSDGTLIDTILTEDNDFYIEDPMNGEDYYIRVRAIDNAENIGDWSSSANPADNYHVYFDNEDPVVTITGEPWNAVIGDGQYWYNADFNVIETDTDNLGVWKCELAITGDGSSPTNYVEVNCSNSAHLIDISEYCPQDGLNVCWVRKQVTDYACNTDMEGNQWDLDRTAPETTKTVSEPKYIGRLFEWIGTMWDLDWFVTDETTFTLECSDFNMSGCDETYYRINYNNGNWSEWVIYSVPFSLEFDGIYEVEYYSVDNVGNVETPQYETDKVDTEAPVTTKIIGEPKYYDEETEKLWVTSDTFFELTCEDSQVGCNWTSYVYRYDGDLEYALGCVNWWDEENCCFEDGFGFTINGSRHGDGLYWVQYSSGDHLGNLEEFNYEYDWLDNTPPEINIINPTENQEENKCSLSVVSQVWDLGSGVDSSTIKFELINSTGDVVKSKYSPYSGVLDLEGLPPGDYTLRVTARDNIGNVAYAEKPITLLSGVFVEQVLGNCNLEAGEEAECSFSFQMCVRDSSAVALWTSKLYSLQNGIPNGLDVIDPFTLNATIYNGYGSSPVGLKEDGIRYDSLTDPYYQIPPLALTDDECEKINGRIYNAFTLNLSFSAEDTDIIGSNTYYFDYDLQAYNYDDICIGEPLYERPCGEEIDLCTWNTVLPLGSEEITNYCGLEYNTLWSNLGVDFPVTRQVICEFDTSQNNYGDYTLFASIDNDIVSCTLNGQSTTIGATHSYCASQDPRNEFNFNLEGEAGFNANGQNTLNCVIRDNEIVAFFDACVVGTNSE